MNRRASTSAGAGREQTVELSHASVTARLLVLVLWGLALVAVRTMPPDEVVAKVGAFLAGIDDVESE